MTSLDQALFWGCLEWFYLCRIVWFYAELYKAQKDKPGPSFVWGCLEWFYLCRIVWFYAELYKAQKDKPGPSCIWGCFRMDLCRTMQGAKRQAWTELIWWCLASCVPKESAKKYDWV
jgi:hypothetical protein